jgi:hypothetical protein
MGKPIVRPKVHYLKAIYADYAQRLLAAHPEWWGKYEKKLKLKNCYIYAKGQNGKVIEKMSWHLYKEVIERFYHQAKDAIIQGESLRLGANLGKLRAVRIQRNFSKPKVNWGETYKQNLKDDNGKLIKIYYTDDDYCRIEWAKVGMIPNEVSYNFSPANKNMETGKGFKKEFINALNADPLLKFKYKYYPIINRTKQPCNTLTAACAQ